MLSQGTLLLFWRSAIDRLQCHGRCPIPSKVAASRGKVGACALDGPRKKKRMLYAARQTVGWGEWRCSPTIQKWVCSKKSDKLQNVGIARQLDEASRVVHQLLLTNVGLYNGKSPDKLQNVGVALL